MSDGLKRARAAALLTRTTAKPCGYAKRYKGVRRPMCLGGIGCDACWAIFRAAVKGPAL